MLGSQSYSFWFPGAVEYAYLVRSSRGARESRKRRRSRRSRISRELRRPPLPTPPPLRRRRLLFEKNLARPAAPVAEGGGVRSQWGRQGPSKMSRKALGNNVLRHGKSHCPKPYKTCRLWSILRLLSRKRSKKSRKALEKQRFHTWEMPLSKPL